MVFADNDEEMLEELRAIRRAINADDDEDQNIDLHEPSDENTLEYFSTGPRRLLVEETGDTFRRLDFGFRAASVNIRTTDDLILAFDKPRDDGKKLKIRGDESPFTIGGDPPLHTGFVWVQQADSATSTPEIEVLAYR